MNGVSNKNYTPNGDELKKMKSEEIRDLKIWVQSVDEKVGNHITEASTEIGLIKTSLVEVKTDTAWIKRFFWVVITATISSVLGIIILIVQSLEK